MMGEGGGLVICLRVGGRFVGGGMENGEWDGGGVNARTSVGRGLSGELGLRVH